MLFPGEPREGKHPQFLPGGLQGVLPSRGVESWGRSSLISFPLLPQILKPADKNKGKYGQFSGLNPAGRPVTPPRNSAKAKK